MEFDYSLVGRLQATCRICLVSDSLLKKIERELARRLTSINNVG